MTTARAWSPSPSLVAALRRDDLSGSATAAAGALAGLAAVALALPSAALTTVALAVLVLVAAAVACRGRFPDARDGRLGGPACRLRPA